ncbi:473_t:CDS:2, partial [Gigaspora rosea]
KQSVTVGKRLAFCQRIFLPMDAQEYIIADNDIITTEMPTDEEIIEAIKNRDCIEPEEKDPRRPISLADALNFISRLINRLNIVVS